MSFDDQVARSKSARWVKASQANYDGDDWSDDEYGEDFNAIPALPELPEQVNTPAPEKDDDEYSYGTAPTPDINVKKFQDINIDEGIVRRETGGLNEIIPEIPTQADDYTDVIPHDADKDDEYIPQSASRFTSFPDNDELSDINEAKPGQKAQFPSEGATLSEPFDASTSGNGEPQEEKVPYDSNAGTSIFAPFPSDFDKIVPGSEVLSEETPVTREPDSLHADSSTEDDPESYGDDRLDESVTLSTQSQSRYNDDVRTITSSNIEKSMTGSFKGQPIHVHDSDDEQEEEEEEEEYVPQSHHFHSDLIDEDSHGDDEDNGDYNEYPTKSMNNLSLNVSSLPTIPIIVEPPKSTGLVVNAPSPSLRLEPPPVSPTPYELSDTDTLHINEPESASPTPINEAELLKDGSSEQVGNTSRLSRYSDELTEHAYLGDLISTPIVDDANNQQFEPETEPEPVVEESKDLSSNRDSQFYRSVSDYFDDYTDEDAGKEQLEVTRTHSSGSLSTGGFSIKSETGYRSSKLSDRTASFGDRTASFTNQSISQSSDVQSTNDSVRGSAEKESHLNPAMSINFGHWRPNTESFRDQFISGTSGGETAPPLPKIDNYTRNSTGEIIEDNASYAESIAPSTGSELRKQISATSSVADTQQNASMLSVLEDEEEERHDLKDITYKTGSETVLPVHIPLDTPGSSDSSRPKGQYFQEHLSDSASLNPDSKKIPTRRPAAYNLKSIAAMENAQLRISKYRSAREEEANDSTGIEIWINHALQKVEVVSYKSPVTSHVKQAYAEASNFSKKHSNMNMGSFLNKRKVLQETSSSAHSIAKGAKGIFSRGKKMIKNELK